MATHSVLAWRIPGMGEPGGLPSLGSHRVGHLFCQTLNFVLVISYYFFWRGIPCYRNSRSHKTDKSLATIYWIVYPSGSSQETQTTSNLNRDHVIQTFGASQVTSVSTESACHAGDTGRHQFDPRVQKIPWRRAWQTTPVFLPGESQGQRNLVGYGPWHQKESDMTERTEHACLQYRHLLTGTGN